MNKKSLGLVAISLLTAPLSALALVFPAMPSGASWNITTFVNNLFNFIWPIVVIVVIVEFIITGFLFLTAQGDASQIEKARKGVIFGVVGVVVILLAFSIVVIVQYAFGIV